MRNRLLGLAFVVLWSLSTALFWRPFADTWKQALADSEFTHILLVLPISAALIFSEWRSANPAISWNLWAGLSFSAASLLIALSARSLLGQSTPDVRLALDMLALVTLWIAAFALSFGMRAVRRMLFPLGFLFWMVPIPGFLLMKIILGLQRGSAFAAWLLFSAFAVPTSHQGVMLSIPGLNIEVARECSSIRSSLMLLVTTIVLAHLLLRTAWRKALVVAIAIPLSVAKNGLRIFTLGMLATRVDPSFLTGRLHHEGGGVFFLIALGLILLLMWILHRGEEPVSKPVFSEILSKFGVSLSRQNQLIRP
jgi:exosortase